MGKIFIGYRREDSAGHSGRLADKLREHFGKDRVFMDISGIEPGVDFVDEIEKAVGSSDAFIVVIGKQWLSAADADGRRRLDNPEDFIRLEIVAALRRNIRVIPVLVQGAGAPSSGNLPEDLKKLSRLQAHEISDNRWDYDVGTLIETLEKVLKKEVTKDEEKKEDKIQPIAPSSPSKFPRWVIAVIAAIVIAIGVYALWLRGKPAIEMPTVVGATFEEAKAMLTEKGLAVSTREKQTKGKPPGTVVDQKPEPGTKLKRGDRVELVLAVRPITKMPNVRGKQIDEARGILNKAGLQVSYEKPIKTNEKSSGTVLNQTPEPGVEVKPEQKVVLEVAVKPVIPVPNVIGDSFNNARAKLEQKGLRISVNAELPSDKPAGTVLEQNPVPGTEVEPGQKVELVVAMKHTVANEQQRQMARNVATDYWFAFSNKDIAKMIKMSSIPFLLGDEIVHSLEELRAKYETFFIRLEKVSKSWEYYGSRIISVNVQTVAEFKHVQHEAKLAARMGTRFQSLGFKDDDFWTVISFDKGKGKETGGLFVRNVSGEVKVAGQP